MLFQFFYIFMDVHELAVNPAMGKSFQQLLPSLVVNFYYLWKTYLLAADSNNIQRKVTIRFR